MKTKFILAAALIGLSSCSMTDIITDNNGGNDSAISFSVARKNATKAPTALNQTNHYNFGVFAYKNTDAEHNVMANYLVGYKGDNVGYYMSDTDQTTMGDAAGLANGQSMWQYEKLGSAEYNYTGTDGYYTKTQTQYMSNVANQYLRYWDNSSASTSFYAYAPYINGAGTATYDNSEKTLTIPDGSVVAAFVEGNATQEASEYMYATTTVETANYGKDVQLNFKRLNAKVNIKFWEDIAGYDVKILDLTSEYGVSAAPSVQEGTAPAFTYAQGEYFAKSGYDINFSAATPAVTAKTGTKTSDALKFTSPDADKIGETQAEATPSVTTYYAIPKNNTTGFTFHVSYMLTSTTGEKITVQNATVFVPAANANWVANTHYTYIFKITKNTSGPTGDPGTINPNDPTASTDNALYPIVFDNCSVEDWVVANSDYNIN
ncbi:MAG: fimbrillin family protein [Bacteroidales bacterium]|nr:fimbrillin family protein [Bacteroidales bacterium]